MARNKMLSELAVGAKVTAEVSNLKRNFIVVHQGRPSGIYSSTFDSATIVMQQDLYESRQWHNAYGNDYAASDIHAYLNADFLNLCAPVIKNNVKQVEIPYCTGSSGGTSPVRHDLTVKIWLPSVSEIGFISVDNVPLPPEGAKFSYFLSGIANDAASRRAAYMDRFTASWYTRSPHYGRGNSEVLTVMQTGGLGMYGKPYEVNGIRPVLAMPSSLYVSSNGALTEDAGISGTYVKKAGVWAPGF